MRLKNPEFESFEAARGIEMRTQYNLLRNDGYPDFPPYTNKETAEADLQNWEEANSDRCTRVRDDGQFFGFKEVGTARLDRFTRFIPIPAVKDASEDAYESKKSSLTQIMDLVVRSTLMNRDDIIKLKERTEKEYQSIMHPDKLVELRTLEKELDAALKIFAPNSEVQIEWDFENDIEIPMPEASVRLTEDEYSTIIESCGHGLQRSYILAMLQYLALVEIRSKNESSASEPNPTTSFLIAIEEPELYQHPNRQRFLSKALKALAIRGISGVTKHTQIVYSTHSPLFVDVGRFDNIRRFRKISDNSSMPKHTQVIRTTLDDVAEILESACEVSPGTYSGETLRPRLQTLMTPLMNEGFFADIVVLVEGEEDRAIILGYAEMLGHDFDALGISVIPCLGKSNLDRPYAIFHQLDIPTYIIWDCDKENDKRQPEENRRLLRLLDASMEDYPNTITDTYACFKTTMTKTLKEEIGEDIFNDVLESCCIDFSYSKQHYAMKNPIVAGQVAKSAKEKGQTSQSLEEIVSRIIRMATR